MRIIGLVSILLLFLSACSSTPSYMEETNLVIAELSSSQSQPNDELTRLCGLGNEASCALSNSEYKIPKPAFAIVQGATTETQTQISLLAKRSEELKFFLVNRKNGEHAQLSDTKINSWKKSPWQVHRLNFSGLVLDQEYAFLVIDKETRLRDVRFLRAFDPKKMNQKILVVSCMDDSYKKIQREMWGQIEQETESIDLAFLIGDNVYADKGINFFKGPATADMIWRRYAETMNRLHYYRFRNLVPSFYTWDDHDYGWNNGDYSYAYRDEAQKIFKSFWPLSEMPGFYKHGPGVSSYVKFSGQNFFFLDDRSFRTPNNQSNDDQFHFGKKQIEWLLGEVKKSPYPTWLISGDQFFGAYHPFESFEGNHPKAFERFKEKLKRLKVPIVFVSGDRHLTEIMKIEPKEIGYLTYELTSSGLHAKVFPGSFKRDPNPRQLVGRSGAYNYMYINTQSPNKKTLDLKVKSWGQKGTGSGLIFEKELRVSK